ncbi:MAG: hypothetical protein HYY04_09045 [Chloroflexi bacterium]|nr:hypothetical protein [Chloroflexota bacterium]
MTPYGLFTAVVYGLLGGLVALVVQLAFYVYYLTTYGPPDVRPVIDFPFIISAPVHALAGVIFGVRTVRESLSRLTLLPFVLVVAILSTVGRLEVVLLRRSFGLIPAEAVRGQVIAYLVFALVFVLAGAFLAMRLTGDVPPGMEE